MQISVSESSTGLDVLFRTEEVGETGISLGDEMVGSSFDVLTVAKTVSTMVVASVKIPSQERKIVS